MQGAFNDLVPLYGWPGIGEAWPINGESKVIVFFHLISVPGKAKRLVDIIGCSPPCQTILLLRKQLSSVPADTPANSTLAHTTVVRQARDRHALFAKDWHLETRVPDYIDEAVISYELLHLPLHWLHGFIVVEFQHYVRYEAEPRLSW
jgi:hypothetical protein